MIANDDVTFDKYYIENALNIIKNTDKSFLVAEYKNEKEINQLFCFNDKNGRFIQNNNSNFKVNCFSMNSTFCKFNYLQDIGDFYPKILPHYLADIEYSYRAIKKGYKVISNNKIKIEWDTKSTGIHVGDEISLSKYFRIVFSKKYSSNPIHWTCFYYLTMKKKHFVSTILVFWIKFILKFFFMIMRSITKKRHIN